MIFSDLSEEKRLEPQLDDMCVSVERQLYCRSEHEAICNCKWIEII
jgi:hypothetical protein